MNHIPEAVRMQARDELNNLYARLQRLDMGAPFRIEETIGNYSVSFERRNWINRAGKHTHRYCVESKASNIRESITRTRDFELAFRDYFLRKESKKCGAEHEQR